MARCTTLRCKQDVRIVDVRHEQTATFAAEGWAKVTRQPGLAVLTAGPGVTNGVSAITAAHFNGTPLVVLGGRAPQARWGSGSLQELDHVPIVASITKSAAHGDGGRRHREGDPAPRVTTAMTPHRGPAFVDIPMDVIFGSATAPEGNGTVPRGVDPDPADVERAALRSSPRPSALRSSSAATCTGTGAWPALTRFVEAMRVPCWFNGLGRGCLPADHELAFTADPRPAEDRRRSRGVVGTAARLPPRVRALRRRARRAHLRCAREPGCARRDGRVAGGRPHRDPRRHDRLGRWQPCRSRTLDRDMCAKPSRPPQRERVCSMPGATRSSRPASTASSASGSRATPS